MFSRMWLQEICCLACVLCLLAEDCKAGECSAGQPHSLLMTKRTLQKLEPEGPQLDLVPLGYKLHKKTCVYHQNIRVIEDQSPDECAKLCDETAGCVAFEYGINHGLNDTEHPPGVCQLQDTTDTSGCDGNAYNLDLFTKLPKAKCEETGADHHSRCGPDANAVCKSGRYCSSGGACYGVEIPSSPNIRWSNNNGNVCAAPTTPAPTPNVNDCPLTVSSECQSEYDAAKRSGNMRPFNDRCLNDPLGMFRQSCRLCCAEAAPSPPKNFLFSQCKPVKYRGDHCVAQNQQCGGYGYSGPEECCFDSHKCEYVSDWLSLCKAPAFSAAPRRCSRKYQQCGGKRWKGPFCCEAGSECVEGR